MTNLEIRNKLMDYAFTLLCDLKGVHDSLKLNNETDVLTEQGVAFLKQRQKYYTTKIDAVLTSLRLLTGENYHLILDFDTDFFMIEEWVR